MTESISRASIAPENQPDIPNQAGVLRYGPFIKGVQYDRPIELVDYQALSFSSNIEISKYGEAKKRLGYQKLANMAVSSTPTGTAIGKIRFSASSSKVFYVGGGSFYEMTSGGSWNDLTDTLIISSGLKNFITYVNAFGVGFFTDGVNLPFKWTGTGNIVEAGVDSRFHSAEGVSWFDGRLWWWNTNNSEDELWYSDLDNREVIDSNAFFKAKAPIVAVAPLQDALYIYTTDFIWAIRSTGNAQIPYSFKQVVEFGVSGKRNVATLTNGTQLIGKPEGYYIWDGVGFPERVSLPLDVRYWDLIDTEKAPISGIVVNPLKEHAWCFLSTKNELDNSLDNVVIYDYGRDFWFGPYTIHMSSWSYFDSKIYTTGFDDGLAFEQESGQDDDGSPIHSTGDTSGKAPDDQESYSLFWKYGKAFFQGGNAPVGLDIFHLGIEDSHFTTKKKIIPDTPGIGDFIIGESKIGVNSRLKSLPFRVGGRGFSSRVRFENLQKDEELGVHFIDIVYVNEGLKTSIPGDIS